MKKTILIISGILILLIVGVVWAYLFTYGAPKDTGEVFANFGIGGKEVTPTIIPNTTVVDVEPTTNTGAPQKLRQLTTRPVAGAWSDSSVLTYVEQGTGHVYRIDLTTGVESLMRGTTIPQTTKALFSPDGVYVVLTTYTGNIEKVIIDSLSSRTGSTTAGLVLPEGATQLAFQKDPSILSYVIHGEHDTTGYTYNIKKAASTKLFTLPLRDVRVIWGEKTYVYTTPTKTQPGYLYALVSGRLQPLARNEYGLMAMSTGEGVAITSREENTYVSRTLTNQIAPVTLIPEKCTPDQNVIGTIYCAAPSVLSTNFPDDWYKGLVSFSDILWSVDLASSKAVVLSNFLTESGREIDVSTIYATGKYVYFINKNDNTLWLFETTN